MKKIVSILTALVIGVCMSMSVFAAEETQREDEDITLYLSYTNNCESTLTVSGKTAKCYSYLMGYRGTTTKITFNQSLQKKNSSGSWYSVTGWGTTISDFVGSTTNSYPYLTSGTYRLKTVFTVYAGSKSETVTAYSNSKTV